MTEKQLSTPITAIALARVAFAGTILVAGAAGLAAPAHAFPCDPQAASMTPHQSTACNDPAQPLGPTEAPDPVAFAGDPLPPTDGGPTDVADGASLADPGLALPIDPALLPPSAPGAPPPA